MWVAPKISVMQKVSFVLQSWLGWHWGHKTLQLLCGDLNSAYSVNKNNRMGGQTH